METQGIHDKDVVERLVPFPRSFVAPGRRLVGRPAVAAGEDSMFGSVPGRASRGMDEEGT